MYGPYGLKAERGKRDGEENVSEFDKIALTGPPGAEVLPLDFASSLREECRHDAFGPHLPDHHY
jgi:hypothetical protein